MARVWHSRSDLLERHALRAGVVLSASALLPIHERSSEAFVWELSDPALPKLLLTLAPALAGAALVGITALARSAGSRPLMLLLAVAAVQGLATVAGAAAPWNVLPIDGSFTGSPAALLALSLALAAASPFAHRLNPRTRSWLLVAAGGVALVYYAVPVRGESPAVSLWREFESLTLSPTHNRGLRSALLCAALLLPAVLVAAAGATLRPARGALEPRLPLASRIAVIELATACVLLASRAAAGWQSPRAFLGAVAGNIVLASLVWLEASALVACGLAWRARPEQARRATVVVSVMLLVLLGVARSSLRPGTSEPWTMGPASKEMERVFTRVLPDWNDAFAREAIAEATGTESSARAKELIEAAKPLDAGLARALSELTECAATRPREGSWYRRVAAVNEASRRAGLPYFVDPTAAVMRGTGHSPLFMRLDVYAIERSRSVEVGSRSVGVLWLRRLRPDRGGPAVLGLSRDLQPLALLVMDEIEASARELGALAQAEPARCVGCPPDDAACQSATERCGARLKTLAARADLGVVLGDITERHELKHQLDGPELTRAVRTLRLLREYDRGAQAEVNRELSAVLAQMSGSGEGAELTLVRLLRSVTLGRRGPEFYAAWLALDALSGPVPRCRHGERSCLLELTAQLAELDGTELMARAAGAYAREFGAALEDPLSPGTE